MGESVRSSARYLARFVSNRTRSARSRGAWVSAACLAACGALAGVGCTPVAGTAVPVEALVNQADLTLSLGTTHVSGTTYLQPESTIDFSFTPTVNLLELTDLDLRGSDVHFDVAPLIQIDATDVHVGRLAGGAAILGLVDPVTGLVQVRASVEVESSIYLNSLLVAHTTTPVGVSMTGTFAYDPSDGLATLTDFDGPIPPTMVVVPPLAIQVGGELTFNFQASVPPPAG